MELGFDPGRVEQLASAVAGAIDALHDCRCYDDIAADAMRVVRLTRQNLEDQWMPLIAGLRATSVLTSWLPVLHGDATAELIHLFASRPLVGGFDRRVHAAVVAAKMSELLGDPDACLDVLSDPYALILLATWGDLPDELVERFVVAGLRDAVIADPSRQNDALRVLATLTSHINTRFDGKLQRGFTLGVARSLEVSAPLIALGLRREGEYSVELFHDGELVVLGTYQDLVDLFGALLRDEHAAIEIGRVLRRSAVSAVEEAGAGVATDAAVARVLKLTDLVADAARAEQAELVAEAAGRASWIETIGSSVGLGVGVALTASGVGAVTRVLTDRAIGTATDAVAGQIEPGTIHGDGIRATVHEIVIVSVVRNAVRRSDVREGLGLDSVADEQWQAIAGQLLAIDTAPDADARRTETLRLEWFIDVNVPALAAALTSVKASPALHELTESRAADPDD